MAHRYEMIPLTQDDSNNSTDSDIETQIDATQLELFPPPPFTLPKTDGKKTISEGGEQTLTAEAAVWASVIRRQDEEKQQGPPVETTVNDPDTSNQHEHHELIPKESKETTLRQPIFSDKRLERIGTIECSGNGRLVQGKNRIAYRCRPHR